MNKLIADGPTYGYYPEPKKSFLVINKDHLDDAHMLFDGLSVNIVTSDRMLGEVVHNSSGKFEFVKNSVKEWYLG